MHKENNTENKRQENVTFSHEVMDQLGELSDVWRELLGSRVYEKQLSAFPGNMAVPILDVDPWSVLLQAKGVEIVDLQHMHLQISDQEVEQILQVIPDDPDNQEKLPLGTSDESDDTSMDTSTH